MQVWVCVTDEVNGEGKLVLDKDVKQNVGDVRV